MKRFALIALLLAAQSATADEWYDKAEPGPFFDPVETAGSTTVLVPFDLDPAEGTMEDYSGWYGTPADGETNHAYDQHNATAYLVAMESEVLAAADGLVVDLVDGVPVGDPNAANYVWIVHDDTGEWESSYWSLYPSVGDYVQLNDEVVKGDVIALSDGVEDEIGPHVDFGTWLWGEAVCPFYNGYWTRGLSFMAGVLQYQDAPVYVDRDAASATAGWQSNWFAYCGTQRIKDGSDAWYRYWHPTDWGTAVAALDRYDGLENPEDYDETGAWESVAAGSRADHVVGYASRGADGAATATFVPRLTTEGEYEVLVTHGEAANAEEVTWRVVHADGEDTVTLAQHGGGTGTWDEPRVVTASPYHDDDDMRRSGSLYLFTYSCGAAPDLSGPEMVYRLELSGSAEVTVTLTHDEDVAMDVALLSEVDDDACLAWGDDTVTETVSGTVYVVVDTPVDDDELSYPGAYELTVSYDGSPAGDSAGDPSDAHQWLSLGTFDFVDGKDAALGAVVLEVADGVAPITDNPARAVADTVLWLNTDRLPFVWSEEGEDAQIADSVLILKDYALLGIKNAGSWPVRAEPSDDAPVTFRAKRGQRFMAEKNYEGWYEMVAPGLPGEWGYLHEDCCFVHHPLPIEDLDDWYPPWEAGDDDDDDSAAPSDDDDGCDCDAASRPSAGVVGLGVLLATLVAVRRRR